MYINEKVYDGITEIINFKEINVVKELTFPSRNNEPIIINSRIAIDGSSRVLKIEKWENKQIKKSN